MSENKSLESNTNQDVFGTYLNIIGSIAAREMYNFGAH